MILEINELSKEFYHRDKKVNAVDTVSFQVKSGELVSIMGHSGCGKSTLFHLITGLLMPNGGSIRMEDQALNTSDERTMSYLRNQRIGYILQEQNLLMNYTVLENVCMPGIVHLNRNNVSVMKKAEDLLTLVGLKELMNSYPSEISGGEARRVAIARALINDPLVLIADEPTSNLDPDNSEIIMKLFRKISDSKVAVMISTHDLRALKYSDKVFIMKSGRLKEKKEEKDK